MFSVPYPYPYVFSPIRPYFPQREKELMMMMMMFSVPGLQKRAIQLSGTSRFSF